MKQAILRYFTENFDDLLALDMKLARMLGAPAPHTLSSWAYKKSPFWTRVIDWIFKRFFNQDNHCKADYDRVTKS